MVLLLATVQALFLYAVGLVLPHQFRSRSTTLTLRVSNRSTFSLMYLHRIESKFYPLEVTKPIGLSSDRTQLMSFSLGVGLFPVSLSRQASRPYGFHRQSCPQISLVGRYAYGCDAGPGWEFLALPLYVFSHSDNYGCSPHILRRQSGVGDATLLVKLTETRLS